MTKKELEIRLQIAENIIKQASYLLSEEGMKASSKKLNAENKPYRNMHAVTCGVLDNLLENYEHRVDLYKEFESDIYRFELPV